MKLVRKNNNVIRFGDLSVGDTFVYNSEAYMKVETAHTKCSIVNAVKLTGCYFGLHSYFMDSSIVEVFKAVLTESVD